MTPEQHALNEEKKKFGASDINPVLLAIGVPFAVIVAFILTAINLVFDAFLIFKYTGWFDHYLNLPSVTFKGAIALSVLSAWFHYKVSDNPDIKLKSMCARLFLGYPIMLFTGWIVYLVLR